MKRPTELLLLSSLLLGGLGVMVAQEKSGEKPPPKVLFIFREFVKPGKTGTTHEKSESAFVQAMARAKWPTHYLAVNSVSGKPRSLFLTGYDSFDAWEKDNLATEKNAVLSAALDRAAVADGDLLSDADGTALTYREDQSLRAAELHIANMRYFEISLFHVKPGHGKEWDDLVKLVLAGYAKVPDAHWATYEVNYGQQDGTYVVFSPLKSASEIDSEFAQGKQFEAAMGEDGMKKLSELEAAAIDLSQTNLFQFSPKMSYVSEEWIKADPEFWKPKAPTPAAPKKPADKPAGGQ